MGYRPRDRVRRFQQGYRMTKNRVAWAKVAWGTVAMMKYDDLDENPEVEEEEGVQTEVATEPGPTVRIVIRKNNAARPVTLDLTMLTAEELGYTRELFDMAFAAALPICQFRDEEAARQHAEGDDSLTRIYRPVPQFVAREGSSPEHLESLRDRLKNVSGSPSEISDGGGVRDRSDELADDMPRGDES